MPDSPSPSSPRPLACLLYLLVAVVATTINGVLWGVGYHHTIATGLLVGAAATGVICCQVRASEERVTTRFDRMARSIWWHGYAAAVEDQAAGGPSRRQPGEAGAVDPEDLREHVERFVAEELGGRQSVRSQGYAEGYVDGIARRGDDPSAN